MRLWITIGILGLVILFVLQNVTNVEVTFLFWTIRLPRAILLLGVFLLGVLLGGVLNSAYRHRRRPE